MKNKPFRHTCLNPSRTCECWTVYVPTHEIFTTHPLRRGYFHDSPLNRADRRRLARRARGKVVSK